MYQSDAWKKMYPWTKGRVQTKTNIKNISHETVPKTIDYKRISYKGTIGIINRNMLHEKILCQQIAGSSLIPYDMYAMKNYNVIIYLGPFSHMKLRLLRQLNIQYPNVKVVIWWIGTDVYNAMRGLHKYKIEFVKKIAAQHLCVSQELQDELRTMGIHAEIETLCPDVSQFNQLPLPEQYTVAVYMPELQQKFYKVDLVEHIVRNTPQIKYIIYGNKGPIPMLEKLPNVDMRGWCKVEEVFRDSSCLLRLTIHDGFPKSVIEAVCYGRYVITNHIYPYTKTLHTKEEIIKEIMSRPVIKPAVIDYYHDNYNFDKVKKRFSNESVCTPECR